MQCQNCRRKKIDHLREYGGLLLCDFCYEKHNPPVRTVYQMGDTHRQNLIIKIANTERELRKMKQRLKQDDQVRKAGGVVHFTTSMMHAFKHLDVSSLKKKGPS